MGKAIPYDQFILRNDPEFFFLLPWNLLILFHPGITHLLCWVREWVNMTSDIGPSCSNTCVTLILPSLYVIPEAPWENWQMLIFPSWGTKAQGKALNACPGFHVSTWCRKFTSFSFLIFYLLLSTSWHIWSETSVRSYFFPRPLSAGNPSPDSFPSAYLFTPRLVFIKSSSSKEFGKYFLQTSPRPVPQDNFSSSILQQSVSQLFFCGRQGCFLTHSLIYLFIQPFIYAIYSIYWAVMMCLAQW